MHEEIQKLHSDRDANAAKQNEFFKQFTEQMNATNNAIVEILKNPPKPTEIHHHHGGGCFSPNACT